MTRFVSKKIVPKYFPQQFWLTLVLSVFGLMVTHSSIARENPGWGNAALVCESPRIGGDSPDLMFKGSKQSFETGFYHIGRLPDPQNRYLGVDNDNAETVLLLPAETHEPTPWLITLVGSDLYQISTCRNGKPRCLVLSNLGKYPTARLDQCAHEARGSQVWWNIGILLGPGKGGWEFGNDNASRMDCLTEMPDNGVPFLKSCDHSGKPQNTWRVEPVSQYQAATIRNAGLPKNHQTAIHFPEGAEVISYQCESQAIVKTYYDPQADQMLVSYQNQILKLDPVISGSGAKFGGTTVPWGWWTKGDWGSIFRYSAEGVEGEFIEQCQEADFTDNRNQVSQQTPTIDPNRIWVGNGFGEEIILSDCHGCGDDIGMTVACQGAANPALASVNWAATENSSSAKTVSIEVNDQVFEREAFTSFSGMLGNVPQFYIQRNDPLIDAFKKGSLAKITFGDVTTHISLKGSQSAFNVFNVHCGWNQPLQNEPPISAQEPSTGSNETELDTPMSTYDGPIWYISEYFDDLKNQQVSSLTYGIPETDAIALTAQCNRNTAAADMDFLLDTGNLQAGEPYYVRLQAGDFDHTYMGQVFSESSEYSGVRLTIPGADTFWSALADSETVYVIPQLGDEFELSHTASKTAVQTWLDHCAN